MTDTWLPPAHPGAHGASTGAAQPASGFGFPPAPPVAAPVRSGLAVAALVVAVVALLGVVGLAVVVAGPGLAGGLAGGVDPGYELEGTLPQAAPGRVYSSEEVRTEVERVLEADWSTYEDLRCEPLEFAPGAFTSCSGTVDDMATDLEVDVDDAVGHFTLTQYW